MSLIMFRSPLARSYGLSYKFVVSSVCRFHVIRHADDVTKCVSGYLQVQHRDYYRCWSPYTHKNSSAGFLHLGHHHCDAALKPRNSFSQPDFPGQHFMCVTNYSTNPDPKPYKGKEGTVTEETTAAEAGEENLSIFKRFKRAYKEHGKILVAVHVATSIVWYGSFYAAARCGLDIIPWLEHWGFSETLIKPFRTGGLGDFAVAYLMYKLATPARYTVTLAGTNFAIRLLRSKGKMAPKPKEDSIRELYKVGRQQFKDSALRKDRLQKLRAARERKKAEKLKKGKRS